MQVIDIHHRKQNLDRYLEKIKKSKNVNRKLILDFYNYCSVKEELSIGRLEKMMQILYKVSNWLKKDFKKTNEKDIENLMQTINKQGFSEWTVYTYKVIIKKFFRWFKNQNKTPNELKDLSYPKEVNWIKVSIKNGNNKLPEEMLTEEEIKKLVNAAKHPRDKALIMSLYESGCRIGELAGMRIKHFQPDRYGAVIIVSGKTGDRRIRLIASAPLLSNWIDIHPLREDPEAPLWITLDKKRKPMVYTNITKIIRAAKDNTDIKKKIYCHLFRHSRASYLANYLTESQLKQYFGWTQASKMAAIYVHLSGKEVDDEILRLNGLIGKERLKSESKLKPIKCERCKLMNAATSDFCGRCGMVLTPKAAMTVEQSMEAYPQIVSKADEKLRRELLDLPKRKLSDREVDRIAKRVAVIMRK